jgi:hypothetical protein
MENENKVKAGPSRPILVTGVVLFLILAAAVYAYFNYQQASDAQLPLSSAASQVAISNPANGAELTAFEPVMVNAQAIGPAAYLSVELWINGELASVQAGPSAGKTPLSATFGWLPKEEGSFSLVARAIDENGQTSTSPAVQVTVLPNEDSTDETAAAFADVPALLPAGEGGYSPPAGPGAGDSVSPADPDPGNPGNQGNEAPPAAPELVLESASGSCEADLLIHDLSDNEDGFIVFRQLNNGPWQQLTTLAAQSQTQWIELLGVNLVGGQTTFYVSAFNSEGEAQSNLVSISKAPADCTVDLQGPEVQAVLLEGISLTNLAPPDQLYCYRSLNDGLWARWPASDFFYPDEDGIFVLNDVLQLIIADVEENLDISGYSLMMECWGWFGSDLQYLGELAHSDQQLVLGEAVAIGTGLQAEIGYQALDGEGEGPLFGLGGDLTAQYLGDQDLILKYIFPPDMVAPAAFVTYEPEECTNHLPPDAQNLLGTILFCFPYPGFHGGFAEGDNPQPYLAWNFFHVCDEGYGWETEGGPCKSYQYWLDQAAANGGQVGFYIEDYSSEGHQTWTVSMANLTMFTIPPNGCNGARSFFVRMWYEEDGFRQYSPYSNDATIECPKPVGDVLSLDFTFDTLSLSNHDDGDDGAQTMELFGYFQVMAPSSQLGNNNYLKMGAWDEQWSDCPDDTDYFVSTPPGSCTQRLTNGTHNLAGIPLCKSSDYKQNSEYHCYRHLTANHSVQDLYQAPNNTLQVQVQDGDAITLWVVLHDWDDASGNDLTCWGYSQISSKTIFEWDAMDGAGFGITAFGDASSPGQCNISGTIHVND